METKISDTDILDVARNAKLRSADLEFLYIKLGLDETQIENAKRIAQFSDFKLQAINVLREWRRFKSKQATRKVLLDALEDLKLGEPKQILEEKWNPVSQDSAEDKLERGDIEFGEQLGEGAYGVVHHVTFKKPFKGYKEAAGKSVLTLRREEIEVMKKLCHPNIVTLIEFYEGVPLKLIIMEYASKGSLCKFLCDESQPLPEDLKCKWMNQAAAAVEYLHLHDFLHRDIKASNCLLFADDVLKLSDFGLARAIQHTQSASTIRGTYRYMPPEILKGCEEGQKAEYSKPGDLYAYGMLMLEIYTRKPPFEDKDWKGVLAKVSKEEQPGIPECCPHRVTNLMRRCWSRDPKLRPTIQDVRTELKNTDDLGPMGSDQMHIEEQKLPEHRSWKGKLKEHNFKESPQTTKEDHTEEKTPLSMSRPNQDVPTQSRAAKQAPSVPPSYQASSSSYQNSMPHRPRQHQQASTIEPDSNGLYTAHQVRPSLPPTPYQLDPEKCYTSLLTSIEKGRAYILNMTKVRKYGYGNRTGSKVDVQNITHLFGELGYDIDTHTDLSVEDINATLDRFIDHIDDQCASSVVVLMSHGVEGLIYGVDGKTIRINNIVDKFKPNRCPALANKPKLFFIQSCRTALMKTEEMEEEEKQKDTEEMMTEDHKKRTAEVEHAVEYRGAQGSEEKEHVAEHPQVLTEPAVMEVLPLAVSYNIEDNIDSEDNINIGRGYSTPSAIEAIESMQPFEFECVRINVPEHADIYISFSTTEKSLSFRDTKKGSWFIQTLVQVFLANAHEESLHQLMNQVTKCVSDKEGNMRFIKCTQTPQVTGTLRKDVYFHPKYERTYPLSEVEQYLLPTKSDNINGNDNDKNGNKCKDKHEVQHKVKPSPRRSNRKRRSPPYLKDYVTKTKQ